ncbi:hypothetical protein J7L67_05760 [bacterium]|nr:hypothetical protein [bacterium]
MRRIRQKALTIIELLVIVAVVMILAALIVVVGRKVKASSYSTLCLNNLRQISIALLSYYNDHSAYPVGLPYTILSQELKTYVAGERLFICPSDCFETEDSYTQYYVYRGANQAGATEYVIGCPRHEDETSSMNIFSLGRAQKGKIADVIVDEINLKPGESVDNGTLVLEDGSTVTTSGVELRLIQSFRMSDGRLYSIVRVPEGESGSITADIIPGSAFEIVTPSSIAAVRGTSFIIKVSYEGNISITDVGVTAGVVETSVLNGGTKVGEIFKSASRMRALIKPGESIVTFGNSIKPNIKALQLKAEALERKIRKGELIGQDMSKERKLLDVIEDVIANNGIALPPSPSPPQGGGGFGGMGQH